MTSERTSGPVQRALLFTLFVPGTATVAVPALLLTRVTEPWPFDLGPFRFAGLPVLAAGAVLGLWCIVDFVRVGRGTPAPWDPPARLVTRGPYVWVRNPMYAGVLLVVAGEAVLYESGLLAVYAGALFLAFHLFVRFHEEPNLRRRFGDDYGRYLSSTPRWLPRPPVTGP